MRDTFDGLDVLFVGAAAVALLAPKAGAFTVRSVFVTDRGMIEL